MVDIHVWSSCDFESLICRITLAMEETAPMEKTKKSRIFVAQCIWTFQSTMIGTDRRQKSEPMWKMLNAVANRFLSAKSPHFCGTGSFPAASRSKVARAGRQ